MSAGTRRESFRAPISTRTRFALRPAVVLAWRLSFARWTRALLIVALIGVPIAGLSASTILIASMRPTTDESLRLDLGSAQSRIKQSAPDLAGMTQDPTNWDMWDLRSGSPAATSDGTGSYADVDDFVPDGAAAIPVRDGILTVQGPKVPFSVSGEEGSTWDSSLEGHWHVIDGRAPRDDQEVMVTPATLARLGAHVGDTLAVIRPVGVEMTIVGTMRDLNTAADEEGVFVPFGSVPGFAAGVADDSDGTTVYLPRTSLDWPQIRAMNAHGIVAESRAVVLDPPPHRDMGGAVDNRGLQYAYVGVIGLFALFEVCLLAAAAFLVGTRADTRTYAIVSSVGADRRFTFAVVSGSGAVLGATAAVLGTALGAGLGVVAFHLFDNGSRSQWPGLHVSPLALGAVAVAGVLAGWVASLVAARAASRVDAIAALRGSRRPPAAGRRRGRVLGPVLLGIGALMTIACGAGVLVLNDRQVQDDHWVWVVGAGVALGPCLAQLGMVFLAPALLAGASRLAQRFGLAARMAVRDARRNPVRTVPVLAAVMSVVFVATVLGTYVAASQARTDETYEYRTAAGVAVMTVSRDGALDAGLTRSAVSAVAQATPHRPVHVLATVPEFPRYEPDGTVVASSTVTVPHRFDRRNCAQNDTTSCSIWLHSETTDEPHVWVGTESDLALLMGRAPSAAARHALADGKAVSLWPELVRDGAVRLDTFSGAVAAEQGDLLGASGDLGHTRIPAALDVPSPRIGVGVFMTRATAAAHGIDATPSILATPMDHFPDGVAQDELSAAWASVAGADLDAWSPYWTVETGPDDYARMVMAFVLAIAGVVTLAATAVAIGLARSDGRRDDEVLDAIGAPPRLRRAVSTWQAGLLTGVGAVVGVLLGLLPLRGLTLRFTAPPKGTSHLAFVVDPLVLAALVVGLPLVVTLGVWLTSGRSRRVSVRRVA